MKSALILGATGLIGEYLLNLMLEDDYYDQITAISRQGLKDHPKLSVLLGEFSDVDSLLQGKTFDHVFCCLGTTMKKARSKEQFIKVDYSYPLKVAELTYESGASKYLLVTAMGADPSSSFFYNKVKGELERDLRLIGFESLHLLRPSLLLGNRKEFRFGERIGQAVFKLLGFLFIGPLKKYKGINYRKVAYALLYYGKEHSIGVSVHLSDEMQNIGDE